MPRIAASGNGHADPRYPSDDYNARTDHRPLLEGAGWRYPFHRGRLEYWRRPGKETGISGTWGYAGQRLFYCFITNAPPLEEGRAYSPFALYAHFEHSGDYAEASRDLRRQGYGQQSEPAGIKITRHGEIIRPSDPGYDDAQDVTDDPYSAETRPEVSQMVRSLHGSAVDRVCSGK